MNDKDKKLIEKWFASIHIYNQLGINLMEEEIIDLCRKAEQMEKDIKYHCEWCHDAKNDECISDCIYHKYGFWKE